MRTSLKIAGLSAVLATILVAAVDLPTAGAAAPAGKVSLDRLPENAVAAPSRPLPSLRGEALRDVPQDPCAKAAWPYVPRDCLAGAGAPARAARVVAIR